MANQDIEIYRREFVDGSELLYPAFHAETFRTQKGTSYLREPGVVMVAQSVPHLEGLRPFLEGFDTELEFTDYLNDPDKLDPAVQIVKLAGQMCYMSLGPEKRTMNKDVERYLTNIKSEGHGSVMEHPNFTFLLYGISRSVTHELVRHRAGMGYSQESQRYVGGNVLRFVERPEFQSSEELHRVFEERIDRTAGEYEALTTKLVELQGGGMKMVVAEQARDKRKKVRQASRSLLTNDTEAIIVATGNLRSWRHIINMRASEHAEIEIRRALFKVFLALRKTEPVSFSDMEPYALPDGTYAVKTPYPKV